jgi:hypothetical protein
VTPAPENTAPRKSRRIACENSKVALKTYVFTPYHAGLNYKSLLSHGKVRAAISRNLQEKVEADLGGLSAACGGVDSRTSG